MDANILFDEGAQRSFISQDLAQQLELKPLGTEVISISRFGGGNNAVRHLKKAKIHVRTDDGCNIEMDVLVVPEIASPIQTHTHEITKLPYLRVSSPDIKS